MSSALPIRYPSELETPDDGEAETIAGVIGAMKHQTEKVAKRNHHAVRVSDAKSLALAVGELTVRPDPPPELAQGLVTAPGVWTDAERQLIEGVSVEWKNSDSTFHTVVTTRIPPQNASRSAR